MVLTDDMVLLAYRASSPVRVTTMAESVLISSIVRTRGQMGQHLQPGHTVR